ncbi:heterocyst differentiation related protein [Nodularia sp. UHCC 0506]|uniref:heterocyst differentiation related protein n=1 Tax=Nodularia sp. UHCC 0506 TaxID=3110243 RepID=UPI002B1FA47D|nr:heterocyst differentiation related protein [Nodularia sp. UHCC 0506]MEA5514902.1 heterocyst differentiation related protein [Nodularia sp. UHCC 0506]
MSESMAFIGGVAVAGLAALVLLRGADSPMQSNFAVSSPQMPANIMPQMMQQPLMYPPYGVNPYYPNPNQPPVQANPEQRVEMERLNMQLERLKSDNEQLRAQNQQLQFQFQHWNNQQMQLAQQNSQKVASEIFQPQTQNSWWSSPMLWAVGGATLTIGGGVVVAGVLALFSPRQRPTRTVQVMHPYHGATPHLAPVRRAEFLPSSRMEARRVESPEYDEMH